MSEAYDFGLRCGMTIPICHGRGEVTLINLISKKATLPDMRFMQTLSHFQVLAPYIHESVSKALRLDDNPLKDVHLTPREVECLLWATKGKTSWESGRILNISERTVIFHLHNSMQKLNVSNKTHAIAKAMMAGLISE